MICLLFAMFLLAFSLPSMEVSAETAGGPVIALTHVPAYGEGSAFTGVVFTEDGRAFDPAAYRVTLYVELTQWGTFWPKPTLDHPYVELSSEGSFTISYDSAIVSDREATSLHLLLLPADYFPTQDFAAAEASALDHIRITRTADGGVTVSPQRNAPMLPGQGKTSALPVSPEKIAVDAGFYTTGMPGSGLDPALIRTELGTVAEFADTVRFYGAAGELYPAYETAHSLGLKTVGTAWLSKNRDANQKELDALIDHCNKGFVSIACVGNETLLRGDLSAAELIADMEYVRAGLTDKTIPVTTSDDVRKLLENPSVRGACDLLMPNIHPYWGHIHVSEAAVVFSSAADALKAAEPEKEIIISETGWPTEGSDTAGPAEAAAYFTAVREWSLSTGTQVLWFDAFDEPWKAAAEGAVGAHWGLMGTDLALKDCFAGTEFFRGRQANSSD
jgi:exo-beta-1,3-glucanase (GH17 family)